MTGAPAVDEVSRHALSAAFFDAIAAQGVLPLLVAHEPALVGATVEALVSGGCEIVEVALRTPEAMSAVRAAARVAGARVGVGTVIRPEQVDAACEAGATFVVSPGFSPGVLRRATELGLPVLPGAATATEAMVALDAGCANLKLFPAEQLGGASLVRALGAALVDVRFVPTGGVTDENLDGYLAEPSVLAVGGSWMVPPSCVRDRDFTSIERRTREAVTRASARAGHGQDASRG